MPAGKSLCGAPPECPGGGSLPRGDAQGCVPAARRFRSQDQPFSSAEPLSQTLGAGLGCSFPGAQLLPLLPEVIRCKKPSSFHVCLQASVMEFAGPTVGSVLGPSVSRVCVGGCCIYATQRPGLLASDAVTVFGVARSQTGLGRLQARWQGREGCWPRQDAPGVRGEGDSANGP